MSAIRPFQPANGAGSVAPFTANGPVNVIKDGREFSFTSGAAPSEIIGRFQAMAEKPDNKGYTGYVPQQFSRDFIARQESKGAKWLSQARHGVQASTASKKGTSSNPSSSVAVESAAAENEVHGRERRSAGKHPHHRKPGETDREWNARLAQLRLARKNRIG